MIDETDLIEFFGSLPVELLWEDAEFAEGAVSFEFVSDVHRADFCYDFHTREAFISLFYDERPLLKITLSNVIGTVKKDRPSAEPILVLQDERVTVTICKRPFKIHIFDGPG